MSIIDTAGALLRADAYREAFLHDQRQNGASRSERHDTADLTRRYGEIGISAVAAALVSRARNNNDEDTSRWTPDRRPAA